MKFNNDPRYTGTMETKKESLVTKDNVVVCKLVMAAIANVIAAAAGGDNTSAWFDAASDALVVEALELYGSAGRTDVDDHSVMIGSDMRMGIDDAVQDGARGYALFERLVDLVVAMADARAD